MSDCQPEGALEVMTHSIEFQIRKHGSYLGAKTAEEVINLMTPYELLTLVADHLDEIRDQKGEA